jgi:predicted SAM-dependent methyltransferase
MHEHVSRGNVSRSRPESEERKPKAKKETPSKRPTPTDDHSLAGGSSGSGGCVVPLGDERERAEWTAGSRSTLAGSKMTGVSVRERIRLMLPLGVKSFLRSILIIIRSDSIVFARLKTRRYVASRAGRPVCLHLGCGRHFFDGWLNVDRLPADRRAVAFDLRKSMRFLADESVDFIYHEDFLEHVDRKSARKLLTECHRVLRRNGRMRIAIPDLDRAVQRYLDGSAAAAGDFAEYRRMFYGDQLLDTPGEMLNLLFHGWEHLFVYGEKDITRILELNGFRNIRRVAYGQSDVEALRGLERRPPERGPLIVEAEK